MKNAKSDQGELPPPQGKLATAALRVLDACEHWLKGLHARIQRTDDHGESAQKDRRTHPSTEKAQSSPSAASPRGNNLPRHRMLVILLCLLLGAGVGTLFSYRFFSATIGSQGSLIDQLQEEIDQSKKAEAINLSARIKYQREMNEYRKALLEAQQANEDMKGELDISRQRVEELSNRLSTLVKPEKRMTSARHAATPPAKVSPPKKTGTCVTGTTNLKDELTDCIDKFNKS